MTTDTQFNQRRPARHQQKLTCSLSGPADADSYQCEWFSGESDLGMAEALFNRRVTQMLGGGTDLDDKIRLMTLPEDVVRSISSLAFSMLPCDHCPFASSGTKALAERIAGEVNCRNQLNSLVPFRSQDPLTDDSSIKSVIVSGQYS